MERPILFNTSMVRAIQEGRKTVTRRAIRPQPEGRCLPLQGCDPPPAQSFPQFLQIPGGEQTCPSAHVLGFGRSTRSKVITHTQGFASQP